jgi:PDZ domain-containing secreted protein
LPGSGLTVNIEILRATSVAGTGTIAVDGLR